MNVKVMGLVVAGGIALASGVQAAEFARYSFAGANASALGGNGTSGNVDAATAFGSGGPVTILNTVEQTNAGEFGASGYPTGNDVHTDGVTFTFTPIGTQSLTTLRLDERQGASGSTSGPRGITIRSSATGATNLLNDTNLEEAAPHHYDVALSGQAALQNINSAVTFTIYGWDSDNATEPLARMILDNIVLEGPGIPEPASIGLVALGATALIRRRRA